MSNLPELPTVIQYDLNDLFTGDKIGHGTFRDVYHCRHIPNAVVKIMRAGGDTSAEDRASEFANVVEWKVWQAVKDTRMAKYFAPCVDISPCGQALIMAYARPLREEEWPKHFPDVLLDDFRDANIGIYDGRVVIIDYARNGLLERAAESVRLVRTKRRAWQFATEKSSKKAKRK